jgi:hypothetical protein
MPRILAAILLVAVLAIGGGLIATTAYQAGLGTAITTATGDAGTAVTPVVVTPAYGYGYGPGWHPGFGFGFFGFLGTLLFLFIVFALLRAIFWRGGSGRRGWGPGGWGGYGYGKGTDGSGYGPWASHANQSFDEWHRRAHGEAAPPEPGDPTKPTGTA